MEENKLVAQPSVIKAQIQIIRAGTGKVEDYTITGTQIPIPNEPQAPESPAPDTGEHK